MAINFNAMKFFVAFVYVLFFVVSQIFASPAYPNKIKIRTADGDSIWITLKGNEKNKYALTEDGYVIQQRKDGWYYLEKNSKDSLSLSEFYVSSKLKREKTINPITEKQYIEYISSSQNNSIDKGYKTYIQERRTKLVNNEVNVLVVLLQFPDCKCRKTQQDFFDLFNKENYCEDGAKGSVYDYYKYVSYGKLQLKCDVIGPYTTKNNMDFYGGNKGLLDSGDRNVYEMFKEALSYAANTVDLSNYDCDGDGYVDNLHIIYAGYGEEAGGSSDAIWAHESTFEPISVQNMKIDRYSCAAELRSNKGEGISRIGAHCHEIGHALGANDYYDVDYSTNGAFEGTGKWDIMASGSWNNEGIQPANFNPYVKAYNFGWIDVVTPDSTINNMLPPSSECDFVYRVNTEEFGDYYLLENRRRYDFDEAVPGEGLLIYHVGPGIDKLSASNSINSQAPQMCYVVSASSTEKKPSSSPSTYGNINSDGTPYPGTSNNHAFTEVSTPAAICINGAYSGIALENIEEQGDGNISFDFVSSKEASYTSELLWYDDFEYPNYNTWSQTSLLGKSSWTIVEIKAVGSASSMAQSGSHYYTLAPPASDKFGTGKNSYKSRLSSHKITGGTELYELNLYYKVQKENNNAKDSLTILYKCSNDDEWNLLHQIELTEINKWIPISCQLDVQGNDFQIAIDGFITSGSSVSIDNFRISKDSDNVDSIVPITRNEQSSGCYTINGIYYNKYNPNRKKSLMILQDSKKVLSL